MRPSRIGVYAHVVAPAFAVVYTGLMDWFRSLDVSLAQHKESVLHEMSSQTESIRLELGAAQRESTGKTPLSSCTV